MCFSPSLPALGREISAQTRLSPEKPMAQWHSLGKESPGDGRVPARRLFPQF